MVTPTYNEVDNLDRFVRGVRRALPHAALMIVDDNSPDGTGKVADELAEELGGLTVLHRQEKNGLGNAYRHAFVEALATDAEIIIHMDADLSHDPAVLPALVAAIEAGADMVIGSRYVAGGATQNWPLRRRVLSRWGNWYTARALGLPVRDVTAGFRAWRRSALAAVDPASTTADGYAFLSEMAMRANDRGLTIGEVPILFADRTEGSSKMSGKIIRESMTLVTRWGIARRWHKLVGH